MKRCLLIFQAKVIAQEVWNTQFLFPQAFSGFYRFPCLKCINWFFLRHYLRGRNCVLLLPVRKSHPWLRVFGCASADNNLWIVEQEQEMKKEIGDRLPTSRNWTRSSSLTCFKTLIIKQTPFFLFSILFFDVHSSHFLIE